MEEINEEKFNEEENIQDVTSQAENQIAETVAEVAQNVEESVAEEIQNEEEAIAEETPAFVDEPICENCTAEEPAKKKCCNKKLCWIIAAIVGVLAIVAIILACMGKFSKYPGFKKDRKTGIYYQFYGDIHDTAATPKTGDLVGFLFSLRAGDSTLIPMMPNEMIMDSLYESDFYAALRMMHVGDSATFIFNGKDFFKNFMQNSEYPFGEEPLFMDIMLYGQMDKADFEKARAEYEQTVKQKGAEESEKIAQYVKEHNITAKPTEEGLYITTTKKGTGEMPQNSQTVKVHYTGKLLDGTVFDSSVERNEPFSFVLGAHQVIPGWEIALSKMHVGEKATVIIPSNLAYGERGNYGIPPFSTLVFDIELLGIE